MTDCIFCKIVKGDLPSYKIYEDTDFLAFLDVYPRTLGHTLVIPKKHYRWVYDVPNFKDYWGAVHTVTGAMQKALSPSFVTYVTHGLQVPHAHIHVLPRGKDETTFVPDTKTFSKEKMQEVADKIKSSFFRG